jgi:phosphoribosylformylglycinamidine synthase
MQRPGGDAGVIRIGHGGKAIAVTTDCTPRYCAAEPLQGGRQAVAEAWRNLSAVGARPLAVTDCLNFGNPERPEIMGQFVGCIHGMAEACEALEFPVVSGNVSFYNETQGAAVQPAPTIGGVGLIDDLAHMAGLALSEADDVVLLIGETRGHLGQSLYLREICGLEAGPPPPVDLAKERRHGDFVREVIIDGLVDACHDVSDGGLLVALAEMALAGDVGVEIEIAEGGPALNAMLFGEDQGRYLLALPETSAAAVLQRAADANIPAQRLGLSGGKGLTVNGVHTISVAELRHAHAGWLPEYMASPST